MSVHNFTKLIIYIIEVLSKIENKNIYYSHFNHFFFFNI